MSVSPAAKPRSRAHAALQVHRGILLKTEYFEKALCGHFREADTQSIELPEEDPAIFHFVIAFLYEGTYVPIKPIATALSMSLYSPVSSSCLSAKLQVTRARG